MLSLGMHSTDYMIQEEDQDLAAGHLSYRQGTSCAVDFQYEERSQNKEEPFHSVIQGPDLRAGGQPEDKGRSQVPRRGVQLWRHRHGSRLKFEKKIKHFCSSNVAQAFLCDFCFRTVISFYLYFIFYIM